MRNRLVGFDHVASEACIDLFPTGEGDFNVHARESQRQGKGFGPLTIRTTPALTPREAFLVLLFELDAAVQVDWAGLG